MSDNIFNQAVQFLIHGEYNGLRDIIREYPGILHQRSTADHGAQLIHYMAANGIEPHLQKSPPNAVKIAELLLRNGANPNTPVNVYGKNSYVLDLVASSVHPYLIGVQPSLIKILVEGGAKINGHDEDGSPLGMALGFGYTGAAEMLHSLGATVNNIAYAAGLGLLELIKSNKGRQPFFRYKCNSDKRTGAFTWPPPQTDNPKINAIIYAAFHNRIEVVQYFIKEGLDPNCSTGMIQTPLHFAAYAGHLDMVQLLIEAGATTQTRELQWNSLPAGWAKQNGHHHVVDYLLHIN